MPTASAGAVAVVALLGFAPLPVSASGFVAPNYWFAGTRLVFERPQTRGSAVAVAIDDDGFTRFLSKLDATLSYQQGQNYIVITTGDRRTVTFTLGDPRFVVSGVLQTAAFAPYAASGVVYLPFLDLARALYVDPVDDAGTIVLQPQIAALDVRTEHRTTVVTLRGASPLHFKRLGSASDDRVSLAFTGTASTLERDRRIGGAGLQGVSITVTGTPRNPTTVVTFDAPAGSIHALAPAETAESFAIAFAPAGVALGGAALPAQNEAAVAPIRQAAPTTATVAVGSAPTQQPRPEQTVEPAAVAASAAPGVQPMTVTAFDTIPTDAGLNVRLHVSGPVTYQWHRLSDNRWYLDLKPAILGVPSQDQNVQSDAVVSLRLKAFVGPTDRQPTVRVALTLASPRVIDLVPSDGGVTIAVERQDDADPQAYGVGQLGDGSVAASLATPPPNAVL
ncbi:MAG: AMIN domain-containing protein, partial [Candidatus Eremiobacteraeota bacterium]|nr:AMIN domain-containing protein [Candidatus Eremiobacteraeota bacterium]